MASTQNPVQARTVLVQLLDGSKRVGQVEEEVQGKWLVLRLATQEVLRLEWNQISDMNALPADPGARAIELVRVLQLRNKTIICGELVISMPNDFIVLRLRSGEVRRFSMTEVVKLHGAIRVLTLDSGKRLPLHLRLVLRDDAGILIGDLLEFVPEVKISIVRRSGMIATLSLNEIQEIEEQTSTESATSQPTETANATHGYSDSFVVICHPDTTNIHLEQMYRISRTMNEETVKVPGGIMRMGKGVVLNPGFSYTRNRYEVTEYWRELCTCPCGMPISRYDQYRFSGPSIVKSQPFSFPYATGKNGEFRITTASRTRRISGTVLLYGGIAMSAVGAVLAIAAEGANVKKLNSASGMVDNPLVEPLRAAGYPLLSTGVVSIIIGGILIGTSKTRVYDSSGDEVTYISRRKKGNVIEVGP